VDPMMKGKKGGRVGGVKKPATPVGTPVSLPAVPHSTVTTAPSQVSAGEVGGDVVVTAPQDVGSTTAPSSLPGSTPSQQLLKVCVVVLW